MAVKKLDDTSQNKTAVLRVTIPKRLMFEIKAMKKQCKEHGLSFDIKPDVTQALEKALKEAKEAIEKGLE